MKTTAQEIKQQWFIDATNVLQEVQETGDSSMETFEVIDQVLDLAALITPALPADFFDKILGYLNRFSGPLDGFTGDSSAIKGHAASCSALGTLMYGAARDLESVPKDTPSWTGGGAEGFAATTARASECAVATSKLLLQLGTEHRELGTMVAVAKLYLIECVQEFASRIVAFAFTAIQQVGLEFVKGSLQLQASVLSHILKGAAAGSVGGALGSLVGGVVAGVTFDEGAEIKKRALEALKNLGEWANANIGLSLGAISKYTSEALDKIAIVLGRIKLQGELAQRAAAILFSGVDPGFNADTSPYRFGSNMQGREPKEMDRDMIALNKAIGKGKPLPDGYKTATAKDLEELGITPDMLVDENGFKARVYMYTDESGNKHPVVAFAGTGAGESPIPDGVAESKNWMHSPDLPGFFGAIDDKLDKYGDDAIEDAVGGATVSPQTRNVLAITEAISNSKYADETVFTGHSLGGRLASIAALDTGNAAVTFNSAGVSQATINFVAASNNMTPEEMVQKANDGQVRRYFTGDDPLTWAQERSKFAGHAADALGVPLELSTPRDMPTSGHELDKVEEQFFKKYGDKGPLTGS